MFEHHFGLRENPFPAGHLLKFVYPSREHQEARAHLRYGIENREPFLLITGEVGTGKTTSLYDALNEWGDRVAVALITNSALTRQELLEEICLRFGLQLQPGISKPAALVMLEKHLITVRSRGEHAVLMMDEAQNLSMDLLEEIRLLSNLEHRGDKLLQIFLVGQPELEAHLARHELRQLRQRITVHYRLNPLSPDETLGYIHHHINVAGGSGAAVFPPDTCREIYRLTHGIPREINTLASSALIAAYAEGSPSVTLAHVTAVAHEGDFRSVLSSPSPKPVEPTPEPAPAPAPPPAAVAPRVQAPPPAVTQPAAIPPPVVVSPPAPAAAPEPITSRAPEPVAASPPAPLATPEPVAASPPTPAVAREPIAPRAPEPVAPPTPIAPKMPARAKMKPPAVLPTPPLPPTTRTDTPSIPQWSPAPVAQAPRASAPPPAPPASEPEPIARERERGEISKGLLAAMRRSDVPPPQPPAPPRARFATQPPAPVPFPNVRAVPESGEVSERLPARLRERLERELSSEDEGVSPFRNWLIGISVLATLGIVLILMQRFGAIDVPILRGAAGSHVSSSGSGPDGVRVAPATPDPTAALVDSIKREAERRKPGPANHTASSPSSVVAPERRAPEPRVPEPRDTQKTATATPAPATPAAPARDSIATAAATTVADGQFGVGVGSYLDADRARAEKDRMARETALPAVVLPYSDAGTTMYRVVIGRWATTADAEKSGSALMERGLINEARVVRLPKP